MNLWIQVVFIAIYPLLLHASFVFSEPRLASLAVFLLAIGITFRKLLEFSLASFFVFACATILTLISHHFNVISILVLIPPILVPLALLTVFGQSLLKNRTPLVTEIGEISRGPLEPEMRLYTRRVTQMWVAVFILMIFSSLVVGFLGSRLAWSLATNILNYLLVAVIFIAEFYLRKIKFPDHAHPKFFEYLKIVATTRPQGLTHG